MVKAMALLVGLVVLFMSPVLWNGFAGDDHALFVNNSFYKDPANMARVFAPGYNVTGADLVYGDSGDKGAGSVAYRPVTSLSFFLDARVWKEAPFGYHLTSLLLHIINTLLLYRAVLFLIDPRAAFVGALLFGIHPVNTEAVAAIAYRSDLLAAFFVLTGFLGWLFFRHKGYLWCLTLSYVAYFLALFSKEIALFFPLVLWSLDRSAGGGDSGKPAWRYHALFLLIACFYGYVYFFIFPNTTLSAPVHWTDGVVAQISRYIQIFALYLKQIFVPFAAGTIPGLYCPLPVSFSSPGLIIQAFAVAAAGTGLVVIARLRSQHAWALVWTAAFFLPAILSVANPNPVALRYLYLPSAGMMVLLALGIFFIGDILKDRMSLTLRSFVCVAGVFALGVSSTLSVLVWKDNFSVGNAWVRYYPGHYMGYGVRGTEFFRNGLYQQAAEDLSMALKDPRCDNLNFSYELGFSYFFLNRTEEARGIFEDLIKKAPFMDKGYEGMGFYYYTKQQDAMAVPFFERAFILSKQYAHAVNLLKALIRSEGLSGVDRGLALLEIVWGQGVLLDKIRTFAKDLSVIYAQNGSFLPSAHLPLKLR